MSEPLDGGLYDVGSGVEPQGDNNGNPAWQEFLDVVPQELHSQVTPLLEKWDKGVQERFQKVHSQYEPWKPILDAGIDPETTQFAVNLLNAIEQDPRMVYERIGEYYKLNGTGSNNGSAGGQGQLEPEADPQDNQYNEKFATLERQQQIMASHLLKQREAEVEAQESARLDTELSQMRDKYKNKGDFNEKYVLAMMVNGASTEEAVQSYYEFRDAELKRHSQKPLIMGSGGALPHLNTDPRKLDDKQAGELAVQMLAAAAAQRNQ